MAPGAPGDSEGYGFPTAARAMQGPARRDERRRPRDSAELKFLVLRGGAAAESGSQHCGHRRHCAGQPGPRTRSRSRNLKAASRT